MHWRAQRGHYCEAAPGHAHATSVAGSRVEIEKLRRADGNEDFNCGIIRLCRKDKYLPSLEAFNKEALRKVAAHTYDARAHKVTSFRLTAPLTRTIA